MVYITLHFNEELWKKGDRINSGIWPNFCYDAAYLEL